jgi:hypothetical protein
MSNPQDPQGNGHAPETKFDFPMGENPFFSEEVQAKDTEQDLSPEGEELDDTASPEGQQDGQYEAQENESPEATFDPEQDAANGIDVESPDYKHFQAAFTRATQRAKAPSKESAEFDEIRRQNTARQIATEAAEALPEIPSYDVNFDGFQAPKLGEDSGIAGFEGEILKVVIPAIKHAVESVNSQAKQYVEATKAHEAHGYLTKVVEEIEARGGPQARDAALGMLREYVDIAKSNPQKWARFVVNSLGLQAEGQAPRKATGVRNPQQVARQVRGQVSRPSSPSAAAPRPPQFKGKTATRDAVAFALEQQLRGR